MCLWPLYSVARNHTLLIASLEGSQARLGNAVQTVGLHLFLISALTFKKTLLIHMGQHKNTFSKKLNFNDRARHCNPLSELAASSVGNPLLGEG